MSRAIYLDHNASAPLLPIVLRSMTPFLRGFVGNPSSIHADGRRARAALDRARATIAEAIHASPHELVFTSGGTESNVLALTGYAAVHPEAVLAVGAAEHPCVLKTADALAKRGSTVRLVRVDHEGRIDPHSVLRQLDAPGALVSIQLSNHELGTIQPIRAITELAHARGAVVHVDAVAAFGKIPVDVHELGVDLLSLSAHKLGGPVGIGALFVRRGTSLEPQMHGGSQEHGLRAGTESVALAVGFATAVESCVRIRERVAARHVRLRRRLLVRLHDHNISFVENSPRSDVVANTINLAFAGADRESLLIQLDLAGFRVSAGAACASGSLEASPVLLACGLDDSRTRCALRLSFGPTTSAQHVDLFVDALGPALARARNAHENF
ncbi:MAG: cysteine desulfurase [Planctomycetes bacterium]|nr:cysteine desulfurase [Planctomycetota bacterium]